MSVGLIHCIVENKQVLNFKDNIQNHTVNGINYDIIEVSEYLLTTDKLKICFSTIEEAFYFKLQVPEAEFIVSTVQLFSKHNEDVNGNILITKELEPMKNNILIINHNDMKEKSPIKFVDKIPNGNYDDWYLFLKLNSVEDVEFYYDFKSKSYT